MVHPYSSYTSRVTPHVGRGYTWPLHSVRRDDFDPVSSPRATRRYGMTGKERELETIMIAADSWRALKLGGCVDGKTTDIRISTKWGFQWFHHLCKDGRLMVSFVTFEFV